MEEAKRRAVVVFDDRIAIPRNWATSQVTDSDHFASGSASRVLTWWIGVEIGMIELSSTLRALSDSVRGMQMLSLLVVPDLQDVS